MSEDKILYVSDRSRIKSESKAIRPQIIKGGRHSMTPDHVNLVKLMAETAVKRYLGGRQSAK
jgi:hypothetical protein